MRTLYSCLIDTDTELTSRVDLTIANNVHIVEPHWSPMAEAQAVDRVHRIGQTREVSVTRYIANDTIETVCLPLEAAGFSWI